MDRRTRRRNSQTFTNFGDILIEYLNDIPKQQIQILINSMNIRYIAVTSAHGGHSLLTYSRFLPWHIIIDLSTV